MSAASCIVAPTPTASPLHAAITGFKELYILRARIPPASLLKSDSNLPLVSKLLSKVFSPEDKSAPAQKALPEPDITRDLRRSCAST